MKVVITFLAYFVALGIYGQTQSASLSCGRYSCDAKQDEWVATRVDKIQKMTRKDWLLVSDELSIPIYRAFTPKQRLDFWQEKFNEVLALDWNEKERAHIVKLKKFIEENPDIFEESAKDNKERWDEFIKFDEEWRGQAIERLGWTKQIVGAIIADGRMLIDKKGTLQPLRQYEMIDVPFQE